MAPAAAMSEPEQEMYLVGNEDGEVSIQCRREGCLVPGNCHNKMCWLEIPVPYAATPMDVDRIWMQHRIEHANLPR